MLTQTDDVRIENLRPLISPAILMEELPLTPKGQQTVATARDAIQGILHGHSVNTKDGHTRDDRLVVIAGPCSIHDPKAGLAYAGRLQRIAERHANDLLIVMRTYFEKPRTTIGWKGLINDPHLDNSFNINEGLRIARGFLRDVVALGLPTGTEFLDPISPQYVADLVSWGAIGARTTESQVHRELASGLSMPVGFKNGTRGTVQIAIDAVQSAMHPHRFLSVTKQGLTAIVTTKGNPNGHVILRGGTLGPNHTPEAIDSTVKSLQKAGLPARVLVDCSHANSGKDHHKQPAVAEQIAAQVRKGSHAIFGVMLESFLVGGRQSHSTDAPNALAAKDKLTYGQSITDACMSWEASIEVFDNLADAVQKRRAHGNSHA